MLVSSNITITCKSDGVGYGLVYLRDTRALQISAFMATMYDLGWRLGCRMYPMMKTGSL